MGRREGACARCGRQRKLRREACRKCRAKERGSERAEAAADIGETAVELGVLRALGRVVRGVLRALTD